MNFLSPLSELPTLTSIMPVSTNMEIVFTWRSISFLSTMSYFLTFLTLFAWLFRTFSLSKGFISLIQFSTSSNTLLFHKESNYLLDKESFSVKSKPGKEKEKSSPKFSTTTLSSKTFPSFHQLPLKPWTIFKFKATSLNKQMTKPFTLNPKI